MNCVLAKLILRLRTALFAVRELCGYNSRNVASTACGRRTLEWKQQKELIVIL